MLLAAFSLSFSAYAQAQGQQEQTLFMAIGEHSELKLPDLKEFSVSNPDTVSHKYRPGQHSLLLRGKHQGHAQVVVWNKTLPKQVWDIYVLSKAKHLQWMETLKALSDLGLETNANGRLIRITGTLNQLNEWRAFRNLSQTLEAQSELTFVNLVTPSESLRRDILSEIYQSFLQLHGDGIDCQSDASGPWTHCLIPSDMSERVEIKNMINNLKESQFLRTDSVLAEASLANYKLTFNIYKLEQKNMLEADMTLERAAGTLGQLNRRDLIALVKGDDFILGEGRFKLSTVANPEIIIRANKKFNIQMGSDLPYQTTGNNETVTTLFRFAGLKINGEMTRSALGNILDYEVELSAPAAEGAISGNKKSSSILLQNKRELTAFKLNYQNNGHNQKSLPFIGRIPVLGALFSDTVNTKEDKIIIGTVSLELMP